MQGPSFLMIAQYNHEVARSYRSRLQRALDASREQSPEGQVCGKQVSGVTGLGHVGQSLKLES